MDEEEKVGDMLDVESQLKKERDELRNCTRALETSRAIDELKEGTGREKFEELLRGETVVLPIEYKNLIRLF